MVKFSIIVVSYRAGERLTETLRSVYAQDFSEYEIIVKDGGSDDGSVEELREFLLRDAEFSERVMLEVSPDDGIYDAMNRAIFSATGEYLLFLNCGDSLFRETTLTETDAFLREHPDTDVAYGNRFHRISRAEEYPARRITPFVCYRNIPCHQACFYRRELFSERGYDTRYLVRADYEHFLWCYFTKKARIRYMELTVCAYEGGGFSETKEHRETSAREHAEIVKKYMSLMQRFWFKGYLLVTLAPFRHRLAENPKYAKTYQGLVKRLYGTGKPAKKEGAQV